MFKFPDLDTRKQHTKKVIQKYESLLNKITKNKKVKVNITYILHLLFVVLPCFILVFKQINIYFYISLIIWILIVSLHFYFNGCIFIRIERELMEDKTWKGIWTYIFYIFDYLKINVTSTLSNFIFILWGISFTLFVILKLLINNNPSILSKIIKIISMLLLIDLNETSFEIISNFISKLFFQKNILTSYSDIETSSCQPIVGNYGILFAIAIGFIFFTPYLDSSRKKKMNKIEKS